MDDNLPASIPSRWRDYIAHYRDTTPDHCQACSRESKTGDLLLVFGDLDIVAERTLYFCADCGYASIERAGICPAATLIYVEPAHALSTWSLLPAPQRERISVAFATIDQIHANLRAIEAERARNAGSSTNGAERPSPIRQPERTPEDIERALRRDWQRAYPLLAYHGSAELKASCRERMQLARTENRLCVGLGWDPDTQCGGALGCLLEAYDPSMLPMKFGIPEELGHILEAMFHAKGIEPSTAKSFAIDFVQSIPTGYSVWPVWILLARYMLDYAARRRGQLSDAARVIASIEQTAASTVEHPEGIGAAVTVFLDAFPDAWVELAIRVFDELAKCEEDYDDASA